MRKISQRPASFRPRERLLTLGAQAIPTRELLTILLGTGTRQVPVEKLAEKVEGALRANREKDITKKLFSSIKGVGMAKTCVLLAAIELSHRLHQDETQRLGSPEAVVSYLQELQQEEKEVLIGLYLNARYVVIHKEVLSIGSINQAILHPRDVFSPIKHHPVAYLILAHNHPSGDPMPSEEDKVFTRRVRDAAELIGVELVDHIIIARQGRASLKELGVL